MPVTDVSIDTSALTLTVIADFNAPVPRLWDAYADPRQIERFWGPPGYPATFVRHDGIAGGRSDYFMTSPEGEQFGGYWEWVAVDAPYSFEVRDGFADADGRPNTTLPTTRIVFAFDATAFGTRITTTSHFESLEELEQLRSMGMDEGLRLAMGQIDGVLSELSDYASGIPAALQRLGDTRARVSRVIRSDVDTVWRAHHDASLLRRWLLGPDGWTMPVCEPAEQVGERFRYEWENANEGQRFGFTGEVLESDPPRRSVTTEAMTTDGDSDAETRPSTRNELTLSPIAGGTLLTLVITYPTEELREQILATGMVDGMEASYARLELMTGAPTSHA